MELGAYYLKSKGRQWQPLHLSSDEAEEQICLVQATGGPSKSAVIGGSILRMEQERGFELPPERLTQEVARRQAAYEELLAAYRELCSEEYGRFREGIRNTIAKYATEEDSTEGITYYSRVLRPAYFRRGIADAPTELNVIREGELFLGEVRLDGGVHPSLLHAMRNAEVELAQAGLTDVTIAGIPSKRRKDGRVVRALTPFVPRLIRGQTGLSAHALGMAVDIDASDNPHLKGATAAAIDAVLEYLQKQGKIAFTWRIKGTKLDYGALQQMDSRDEGGDLAATLVAALEIRAKLGAISEAFKGFLADYVPKYRRNEALVPDVAELVKKAVSAFGKGGIDRVLQRGTIDQNIVLIVAMLRGGAKYGGEYVSTKDQHHFEVRNWQDLYKKAVPLCVGGKRKAGRK